MKVVQIGFGNAARLHRQAFPKGVEIIGIIDVDPNKREKAKEEGLQIFPDISSMPLNIFNEVDFWDICTPDETHLPIMRELLEGGAKKILVEKPICVPSQVREMEELLKRFSDAKICVEETYTASSVVKGIKEKSKEYRLSKPNILMEQSKNRVEDIEKGRFIDRELGVFGYEIPHALSVIAGTGEKRLPLKILNVSMRNMILPSGQWLYHQGEGEILYLTEDGCQVKLFTAMDGEIGYPLLEINAPTSILYGDQTRYRILVLEEKDVKIIGQFEPIPDWEKFKGRVLIYKGGELKEEKIIEDKPMQELLHRAVRYFQGRRKNPAPPRNSLSMVRFLGKVMERVKD